jgi:hypothetical protein
MIKIPTDQEKIKVYEDFLHKINLFCVCGNNDGLRKLIENADAWSYAARAGNGELSEEEQEELIAAKFWKLTSIND